LPTKSNREDPFASSAENGSCEAVDTSLLPATRVDAANLVRAWQQLAVIAKRQAPRIAFKVKGGILFLELAEIVAVQAEGNYVSLQHRPNPHLLHESLSSMAEKLKPLRFYSYPPLGRREYFGRGGDPTFTRRESTGYEQKVEKNTW
jgi:DNA-binding LytR/AlgR family response regulator